MSDWSTIYDGSPAGADRLLERIRSHGFDGRVVSDPTDTGRVRVEVRAVDTPERLETLKHLLTEQMNWAPPSDRQRQQINSDSLWSGAIVLGTLMFVLWIAIHAQGGSRDDAAELDYPIDTTLRVYSTQLDVIDSGIEDRHVLPLSRWLEREDPRALTLADAVRTVERVCELEETRPGDWTALAVLRLEHEGWTAAVVDTLQEIPDAERTAVDAVLRCAYDSGPDPGEQWQTFLSHVESDSWLADTVRLRRASPAGKPELEAKIRDSMAERARPSVVVTSVLEWLALAGTALGIVFIGVRLVRGRWTDAEPLSVPWEFKAGLGVAMLAAAFYLWMPTALYHLDIIEWTGGPADYLYCLWGGLGVFLLMPLLRTSAESSVAAPFGFWGCPPGRLAHVTLIGLAADQATTIVYRIAYARLDTMQWGAFDEELFWGSGPVMVASIFNSVIAAPVFEEVIFRGLLYGTLRQRLGIAPAAIISAIVFTSMHGYASLGAAILVVGGIVFCLLYEWSGSLLPGIIVHLLWNLTVTIENLSI